MNDKLDAIIARNSYGFNDLIERINAYTQLIENRDEKSYEESWKITVECVNAFGKVAEICFCYGNFKDKWDYGKFYQNIFGPELIIKSQKTGCSYQIGLDLEGVYISTDLRFNENLRYMDDIFWSMLIDLTNYEGFKYEETEFTSDNQRKKYPDLFKTNKSIVYKIMRKYFFDQTAESGHPDSCSVGNFKIVMSGKYEFKYIVRQFCLAFRIMYQLNHKLWKVSDLKNN